MNFCVSVAGYINKGDPNLQDPGRSGFRHRKEEMNRAPTIYYSQSCALLTSFLCLLKEDTCRYTLSFVNPLNVGLCL